MVGATNYLTANGEIFGESAPGQGRRDYMLDSLGSVVGTMTQDAAVESIRPYKPYGSEAQAEMNSAVPRFTWIGGQGYRQTGARYADVYVRARHYSTVIKRWISPDPLRAVRHINLYSYADASPVTLIDPYGWDCQKPPQVCQGPAPDCCALAIQDQICTNWEHCYWGEWIPCSGFGDEDAVDRARAQCYAQGISDCSSIIAQLTDAAMTCQKMCNSVLRRPVGTTGGYNPSDPWDAMTIMCSENGRCKFCGYYCCDNSSFVGPVQPGNACSDYCLRVHEGRHRKQCENTMGLGELPRQVNPRDPDQIARWAECDAYYAQSNCLLIAAQTKGCDTLPGWANANSQWQACAAGHTLQS